MSLIHQQWYRAYCNWQVDHRIKTFAAEVQVVSEAHQYAGTADLIAEIDGVVIVLDFKRSTHVSPEHRIQPHAYYAWNEQHPDQNVAAYHLVQLHKANGGYTYHVYQDVRPAWDVFTHRRASYELPQQMEGDRR